jgi:hypothetical protein
MSLSPDTSTNGACMYGTMFRKNDGISVVSTNITDGSVGSDNSESFFTLDILATGG